MKRNERNDMMKTQLFSTTFHSSDPHSNTRLGQGQCQVGKHFPIILFVDTVLIASSLICHPGRDQRDC